MTTLETSRYPAITLAAQTIEELGWCQGQLRQGQRLCALGALNKAWRGNAWKHPKEWTHRTFATTTAQRRDVFVLAAALGFQPKPGESEPEALKRALWTVVMWNDHQKRTKEQVVETLERVGHGI